MSNDNQDSKQAPQKFDTRLGLIVLGSLVGLFILDWVSKATITPTLHTDSGGFSLNSLTILGIGLGFLIMLLMYAGNQPQAKNTATFKIMLVGTVIFCAGNIGNLLYAQFIGPVPDFIPVTRYDAGVITVFGPVQTLQGWVTYANIADFMISIGMILFLIGAFCFMIKYSSNLFQQSQQASETKEPDFVVTPEEAAELCIQEQKQKLGLK